MTRIKALLMALLLVAGAAVLLRLERGQESDEGSKEQPLLPGISAADVTGIKAIRGGASYFLVRGTEKRTQLEKDGIAVSDEELDTWVLAEPPGAPVEQEEAALLLSTLVQATVENVIERQEVSADQSQYGLVPPELLVIISGSFGKRIVSFGKMHPVSKRRYAQPEDDGRLFMVDTYVPEALEKSADDFRIKRPLVFEPEKVRSVVAIRGDEPPLQFRQIQESEQDIPSWIVTTAAQSFEADADLISRELIELSQATVAEYADKAGRGLVFFGLARPELVLRLELEEGAKGPSSDEPGVFTVQIGKGISPGSVEENKKPEVAHYYKVVGQPWVYRMARPFYRDWLEPIDHFRDRMPFDRLSSEDLERAVLRRGSEEMVLVRDAEAADAPWTTEGSSEGATAEEVDADAVEEWLEGLFRLQILSSSAAPTASTAETGAAEPGGVEAGTPETGSPDRSPWSGGFMPAFEIEIRPIGAPANLKLAVGGAVVVAGAEGSEEEDEDAPHHAVLEFGDGSRAAVVIPAANVRALDKRRADFFQNNPGPDQAGPRDQSSVEGSAEGSR